MGKMLVEEDVKSSSQGVSHGKAKVLLTQRQGGESPEHSGQMTHGQFYRRAVMRNDRTAAEYSTTIRKIWKILLVMTTVHQPTSILNIDFECLRSFPFAVPHSLHGSNNH